MIRERVDLRSLECHAKEFSLYAMSTRVTVGSS